MLKDMFYPVVCAKYFQHDSEKPVSYGFGNLKLVPKRHHPLCKIPFLSYSFKMMDTHSGSIYLLGPSNQSTLMFS
jgi:hypothetical protein